MIIYSSKKKLLAEFNYLKVRMPIFSIVLMMAVVQAVIWKKKRVKHSNEKTICEFGGQYS